MSAAADALMGIFGFKRVESRMKTDRELLELAAKAAGYLVDSDFDRLDDRENSGAPKPWRPLIDDGDAMRLAIELGMIVDIDRDEYATSVDYTVNGEDFVCCEGHATEPFKATRRAIVRAAAAIGEQMK